jgi:hypothetical protein
LAEAGIEIGDWKSPEAMQVEQSNRFARDAAEESKKALEDSMTALFNGTVSSARAATLDLRSMAGQILTEGLVITGEKLNIDRAGSESLC